MKRIIVVLGLCFLGVFGQSIGSIFNSQCCDFNEIEVDGDGRASGQPDIAKVRVSFQTSQTTAQQAINDLNNKVNTLILILATNGYTSDDYSTNSISVFDDFQRGQVVGKRASQSITITIRNLDAEGTRVGILIDQISQVDKILIDNVSFDIFDKTSLQEQARARAFQAAKEKAKDYADAAQLNVGRVITIVDGQFDEAPPVQFARAEALSIQSDAAPTQVPVGQLDVTYRIRATFSLGPF